MEEIALSFFIFPNEPQARYLSLITRFMYFKYYDFVKY